MNKPTPAPEPTMEEILASIRRIISEGDDGAAPGQPVAPLSSRHARVPEAPLRAADAGTSTSRPEAHARADVGAPVGSGAGPVGQSPRRATDTAAVDIFELTDDMVDEDGALAPSADLVDAPFHVKDQAQPTPDHDERSGDAAAATPVANDIPPVAKTAVDRGPLAAAFGEPDAAAAAEAVKTAGGSASRPGLLSPQSDAMVAAAFSQLADTILTRDSRTLEDLVGEMLRPMLKDWLDDNLPALVERVVREEIERVSRGRR